MNLQLLASHTVDLDLLPERCKVLDVGSRWFDFSRSILATRPDGYVVAVDPSPDVEDPHVWQLHFYNTAIVGDERETVRLAHFSTGEGNFITDAEKYHEATFFQSSAHNVSEVFLEVKYTDGVISPYANSGLQPKGNVSLGTFWDLVKLDCEGSEFGILENWPGPIATQISVEFHDWDKPHYRSEGYYERLWKLLPWYKVVQHDLSKQGTGVGHWDTLLVLR